MNCKEHDSHDCGRLLALSNSRTEVLKNLRNFPDCYAILKCLLICENPLLTESINEFWHLESHLEKRRDTIVWHKFNDKVVQPLLKSELTARLTIEEEINEDFLQRLYGIIDVNAFEVRAPDRLALRALYLKASLFSHDCNANLNVSVDADFSVTIYTNRNVPADQVLGHCYINALLVKYYCKSMIN